MIAKVEPLTSARALRGPFDYRLPREMEGVEVGTVLVVPFGRRRALGVVVGVAERSELAPERLVEPLAALEVAPTGNMVEVWRAKIESDEESGAVDAGSHRRARGQSQTTICSRQTRPYLREGPPLKGGVPAELVSLALWVAREYCSTPARGLALVTPPGMGLRASEAALRRLVTRGGGNGRAPAQTPVRPLDVDAGGPRPTAAQRAALAQIEAALDGRGDRRLLLHGVTGSGKTEVYVRAAAAALARGRSAIVLVPEIALTPQTAGRFRERLGETVAIVHSKLSDGERRREWLRMRGGEARVCVGPRSAVFAPLHDLGLIAIDEEHDASYKQESDPRYDARDVAARRAEQAGAVLLAGSATPRPESFHALARLRLPERVDGRRLPPVEVVPAAGLAGPLHPRTRDALDEVRRRGEKAVVLLNRRGWSAFLSCGGCGRVWGCPHCDVSLVLHRTAGALRCHHCGHSEPVPEACDACGSVSLARHGAGTQRIERELEEAVAPLPVFRLDSDALASRAALGEVLGGFAAAEAGVLVGTQMVAKGHDFAEVTLGVVLDADATLRLPDFRAEERTFALVAQLAGRSGRGPAGGRVVVQALDPEARALRHAAHHDAEGFLAGELERRRLLGYPPYAHLVRAVCAAREGGRELEAAAALAEAARAELERAGATLLGPAPLLRLRGRARAQLLVKAAQRAPAVRAVRRALEDVAAARAHKGVSFSVDVDPQ